MISHRSVSFLCINSLRQVPGMLGAGLVWLVSVGPVTGQSVAFQSISQHFAQYSQRMPTEKLFLHLDRPSYVSGETMWCKLYAVDGSTNQPLAASKVAYVEVLDNKNTPLLQSKIGLAQGTGYGSLVLPPTLVSGRYTVRAYTRWMQNAGPEFYFHATVTVVNTRAPSSLPVAKAATTPDVQFFPEGGYLVQGLPSKVGFKVTDANGRGVAAEGTILDQSGASVTQFRTLRFGLGSFRFTPAAGALYKAVIKVSNQPPVTVALPSVQAQGYGLRLEEAGASQLRVVVQASGAPLASESIYLLGHAGRQIAVATEAQLSNGEAVFTVDKQKLTDGISHFTLFNSQRQPVCERLYFKPPTNGLALTAQTDKPRYASREKVSLQLTTGQPSALLPANLSVAIYQLDSLSAAGGSDIASYLWLTSDLKGTIESPEYYLTNKGDDVAQATDNLMLTQGWSRFRWANVLADKPDSGQYLPELNGHLVQGRVVNSQTGAPAANIPVYLTAPSRRVQLYNSVSKPDGSIQFEVTGLYGPRQLLVQPNTARDSMYRVELLSPFSERYAQQPLAPLALAPHWAPSLQRRHVQAQVQRYYMRNQPVLYRSPQGDSLAFYGQPEERYMLDDFTRFKVMEEVMREYVPGVLVRRRKDGFHFLVPDKNSRTLSENPMVLLDGMPVFDVDKIMAFDPLKVQKLEVLTTRYFQGPLTYDGIVSYTTYKGDLAGFPLDPHILLQEYEGLQGQREFYAPRYETPQARQSRQPDFRNLLYWNPEVSTTAGAAAKVSFYTSDQVGKYRVVVQGLSGNGQAGSTSFTFDVTPAL